MTLGDGGAEQGRVITRRCVVRDGNGRWRRALAGCQGGGDDFAGGVRCEGAPGKGRQRQSNHKYGGDGCSQTPGRRGWPGISRQRQPFVRQGPAGEGAINLFEHRHVGAEGGDAAGQDGIGGNARRYRAGPLGIQRAVDKGVQFDFVDIHHVAHDPSLTTGSATTLAQLSIRLRSRSRARASLDITVPIGTFNSSAISR